MTEPISDEELGRLRVVPHVIWWFDPLIVRLDVAEAQLAAAHREIERLMEALVNIRDNNFLAFDPVAGKTRAYTDREIAAAALTQEPGND